MSPRYVAGSGSVTPRLMIIGEAPGKVENETGLPFQGPAGQLLDECLFEAGISRSEVYITNVVKFQPPFNDMEKLHLIGVDLNEQIKELWENEIRIFKPNCILAVGNYALQATTGLEGILNYRGSILRCKDGDIKVVPTIHPAALFSREEEGGLPWVYLKLIKHDIKRAAEESLHPRFELPERHLQVIHSSLDLHRFFREYGGLTDATTDIESINCIPVCIGFAFNRWHAISVPLLSHIGRYALTDMGQQEMNEVWRIVDEKLRSLALIGHNLKYDHYKLSLIHFVLNHIKSDTLIKTRVIFPELPSKKLNVLSSIWTRQSYYKEEGKEFNIKRSPIEQLLRYNALDCAVEKEVDEEQEKDLLALAERFNVPLREYYYDYMMKKHKFYLKMENNGFRIDFDRKKELSQTYGQMRDETHKKLVELIGQEVNVKSYPQMFELLYRIMKFKPLKRNPTSEDTIVRLLGNHAKKAEHKRTLELVLEERRIRDQKSRAIDFTPDYDNRCKTVYNISSTETCRSSTGVVKKPLRPKKIGLAFHTIPAHGRLAKAVKSMLIPDKGMIFLKADASQAEVRVVAVLAKDWELLEAFDKVDIHRRTAGLIFGYTKTLELGPKCSNDLVDFLEKDGVERFSGKKVRHAGDYDMQKGRFMMEYNTDCQKFDIDSSISEWKAGKYLEAFHEASPKIRGIFHEEIKQALQSSRVLIDPFGGVRVFNGRMDNELFKEGYANIPQRTVAHLVQGAALKIDDELNGDKAFMWLGEKHDELIMQVPENNYYSYAALLRKHMETPIDFSTYCTLKRDYKLVIPCDVEISDTHYGEFRKAA